MTEPEWCVCPLRLPARHWQVGKYGDINIKCPIKKEFRKYRRTDFLSDLGGYKTEKLRNPFPLFPILLIILSGLRRFFLIPTLSISPSSTNSQGNSVCDESTGKAQSYDKKNEDQFSSSLCFVLTLFYLRLWKQSELTLHTTMICLNYGDFSSSGKGPGRQQQIV